MWSWPALYADQTECRTWTEGRVFQMAQVGLCVVSWLTRAWWFGKFGEELMWKNSFDCTFAQVRRLFAYSEFSLIHSICGIVLRYRALAGQSFPFAWPDRDRPASDLRLTWTVATLHSQTRQKNFCFLATNLYSCRGRKSHGWICYRSVAINP